MSNDEPLIVVPVLREFTVVVLVLTDQHAPVSIVVISARVVARRDDCV